MSLMAYFLIYKMVTYPIVQMQIGRLGVKGRKCGGLIGSETQRARVTRNGY